MTQRAGPITAWLAALVLFGVVLLAWLGYRAASEWQESAELLVRRRETEIATTLAINMVRDMRTAQVLVLDRQDWTRTDFEDAGRLATISVAALRRYSYPDVFFAWSDGVAPTFFAREERLPMWLVAGDGRRGAGPVLRDDTVAALLRARVDRHAALERQYSIFDIELGQRHYQVVARLLRDGHTSEADAVFGFMVDLEWVKSHYFEPTIKAVLQDARDVDVAMSDHEGRPAVVHSRLSFVQPGTTRRFLVTFFDQAIISTERPEDLEQWRWSLAVNAERDPTFTIAAHSARGTMVLLAISSLALGCGLLVIVRATRSAAAIASMRSEFVSTVTHELKTPLSVIQGIGETMARGRVRQPEQQAEYARLLVHESRRLRRLVDNLLAYARVTEVADAYVFEQLQPGSLVDHVHRGFSKISEEHGHRLSAEVQEGLPPIMGDRDSLIFALDNLVDNAIRHSGRPTAIRLHAALADGRVAVRVSDGGTGIPTDELTVVRKRFVRGRDSGTGGSGLGLAIVQRIADDHRAAFHLDSVHGQGTIATLFFDVAVQ